MFEYIHTDEDVAKQRENNTRRISTINYVEGFSPEAEARDVEVAGGITAGISKNIKESWFRLVHPTGCVTFEIISPNQTAPQSELVKSEFVEIKCSIYEKPDALNPLGEAVGFAFAEDFDLVPSQARRYAEMVRLAKGQAESKAYYAAGFGLQFYGDTDFNEIKDLAVNKPIPLKHSAEQTEERIAIGAPTMFVTDEEPAKAVVEKVDKHSRTKRTDVEIYNDSIDACRKLIPEIRELMSKIAASPSKELENKLKNAKKAWNTEAKRALDKQAKFISSNRNDYELPEFSLEFEKCFTASNDEALAEVYTTNVEQEATEINSGLAVEEELFAPMMDAKVTTEEEPSDTKEVAETETTPTVIAETTIDDSRAQLEFSGLVSHPEEVVCTYPSSTYNGKTYGQIMSEKKPECIFHFLDRPNSITPEEVEACKEIIRKDESLMAIAARKGVEL